VSRRALVTGPTPPGTGVIADATSSRGVHVDVPYQMVADDVDPDVHDDRARLEHVARDEPGSSRGDHHDVGFADLRGEIVRPRVADGHRRVLAEQEQGRRLADHVGPADDDGMATDERDPGALQELDGGMRGRRQEAVVPEGQEARVERMDAVDVLRRIEDLDDRRQWDPLGKRHLDDDPGDHRVAVQDIDLLAIWPDETRPGISTSRPSIPTEPHVRRICWR
jgi:hypothetical protein